MNRRRTEASTSALVIFSLILAATIAAAGGILHAYYKNRQIQVAREIDSIERRVGQYRLDIQTTQMRMDDMLNRFVILEQIKKNGSSLRPIPTGVCEEIDPELLVRSSVVSAVP